MIVLDLSILNQKGTPMFNSDTLANRPAAGIVGRIFIAIDSPFGIYRDTGSAWDQISGASTFSGSLATGQVAFGSATNTIAGSNNLFWNNTNANLGIGNNAVNSVWKLGVDGNIATTGFLSFGSLTGSSSNAYLEVQSSVFTLYAGAGRALSFWSNALNRGQFTSAGNLLIGTSVDNGNRFQVSGNTTLGGNLTLTNSGGTSFAYATAGTFLHDAVGTSGQLLYSANGPYNIKFAGAGFGTILGATSGSQTTNNTLLIQTRVNRNANILQFNTSTSISTLNVNVATISLLGVVAFDSLSNHAGSIQSGIKVEETFDPNNTLKDIRYNGVSIQPTINQTGGAVQITRGLIIQPTLTAAADWRSIEWSNNTGWGLYGTGTALNYLGGTLGIKTTSPYSPSTFSLDVNGGLLVKNTAGTTAQITLINADPSIGGNNGFLVASVGGTSGGSYVDFQGYYGTSIVGSTALRLNPAGGAVIVNSTTNSGEQFQLTGSIRVNGQVSGSAGSMSGNYLIINCDGTQYKIDLRNP